MLYKFKSKATGDLIMLEPNGRQILRLIGKGDPEALQKGILLPSQIPHAIAALEAAIVDDEIRRRQQAQEALERGDSTDHSQGVSLRQRATPFIDMLKRCLKEDREVVWGV